MSQITLLLSGDSYQGPPIADITLDGVAITSVPVNVQHGTGSQRVSFDAAPGEHLVVLGYNNDFYGGTSATDRNLYLDGVEGTINIVNAQALLSAGTISMRLTVPAPAYDPAAGVAILVASIDALRASIDGLRGDMKAGALAAGATLPVAAIPAGPVVVGTPAPAGTLLVVEAGAGTPYPTVQLALVAMTPGGSIHLRDGTYGMVLGGAHIGQEHGTAALPMLLAAINPGKVIFDGEFFTEDGVGGPKGTWGKGMLHVSGCATVTGIKFINAGRRATAADGKAAIWCGDGGLASLIAAECSFDGCVNGIFAAADALAATAIRCEFGATESNGQSQTGDSHDVYNSARKAAEVDCFHYGNAFGHSWKGRSPDVALTGGLYTSLDGRAIETPAGGKLRVSRAFITALPGANGNLMGFGDENQLQGIPDVAFDGCKLVANRDPNTILFPVGKAVFSNTTVVFVSGGFNVVGGGVVTGLPMTADQGGTRAAAMPPMPRLLAAA